MPANGRWDFNLACKGLMAYDTNSTVEMCVLLGDYAKYSDNSLPMLQDKQSVPSWVTVLTREEWTKGPRTPPAVNPLKPELNPICYLLALLAHHFLHVSRIRVKSLTIRLLMSYIYMEHLFLMFLDHTQRRSTVGRTPLDE